jgi:hypothetical protein
MGHLVLPPRTTCKAMLRGYFDLNATDHVTIYGADFFFANIEDVFLCFPALFKKMSFVP